MIQAMAAGEATDVAGMRRLINRSIPLKTYQPQDTEAWEKAYKSLSLTLSQGEGI